MKWGKILLAFSVILSIGCGVTLLCNDKADAIGSGSYLNTAGKYEVGDPQDLLAQAQTAIKSHMGSSWRCYNRGIGGSPPSGWAIADIVDCVKPAESDTVDDGNLKQCWIDKVDEKYQAYCGNDVSSAKAWEANYNEDFLLRNCAVTNSSVKNELVLVTVSGSVVKIYDCGNFYGKNDYCFYYTGMISGNETSSEKGCYSTLAEAEEAGEEAQATAGSTSLTTHNVCEKKDLAGWFICNAGEVISGAINALLNNFLLPMLQWRIIV